MRRPNVLLITTDQQHYSMLGSINPKIQTPNLDRLAAEGVLFDRAYCPNPTCTPSRASILTGQYPSRHGAWSLGTKLMETVPTLSQKMTDAGYHTALIGKAHFQPTLSSEEYPSLESAQKIWDFDFWRSFHGPFYGFSHVELLRGHTAEHWVGQHYALWMEEKGLKNWRDFFFAPTGTLPDAGMGRWTLPEEYHYNAFIAEKSIQQMEAAADAKEPFFLWASFPDPHYPQLVPAPWDSMYRPEDMELPPFSFAEHEKNPPYFKEVFKEHPDIAEYLETGIGVHGLWRHVYDPDELKQQLAYSYGMVSFTDQYIGKILAKLDELGQKDNTLVIFTSDHGDLFGQHGLRHKCVFHYEDLLRVPMIVRCPGGKAFRSAGLQSLVDLAPTILSFCGLSPMANQDGTDQKEVWLGQEEKARDCLLVENRHEPHTLHMNSLITERYKITVHEGRSYGELYDLLKDPGEHNNLWAEEKARAQKAALLTDFLLLELGRQAEKSEAFAVFLQQDGYLLSVSPQQQTLRRSGEDENLWNDPAMLERKIHFLLQAIQHLMANEPMPMPRLAGS